MVAEVVVGVVVVVVVVDVDVGVDPLVVDADDTVDRILVEAKPQETQIHSSIHLLICYEIVHKVHTKRKYKTIKTIEQWQGRF